ncbi:hypothetical protein ACO0R3_000302 [Hanseniaspora guilliermondii]
MSTYAKLFRMPPINPRWNTIKDNVKRQVFAETELEQRTLKSISRNTLLPTKVRMQAQLQLSAMPKISKMTQIRNRCVITGTARSVLGDGIKLNRIPFRTRAISGELPEYKIGGW